MESSPRRVNAPLGGPVIPRSRRDLFKDSDQLESLSYGAAGQIRRRVWRGVVGVCHGSNSKRATSKTRLVWTRAQTHGPDQDLGDETLARAARLQGLRHARTRTAGHRMPSADARGAARATAGDVIHKTSHTLEPAVSEVGKRRVPVGATEPNDGIGREA